MNHSAQLTSPNRATRPRLTILQQLGLHAGPPLISWLIRSLRISPPSANRVRTPSIVIFWHGGMLVPWFMHRGTRSAALVSASRDGDVLAALLSYWGITTVRGSSSSGGSEALKEMVRLINDGYTLLITPDGPRGPAHAMKIGALVAAQRTGAPIVLCTPRYHKFWQLRSWDSFAVPKPFSRVDVVWSENIHVDPACVGGCLDTLRATLETRLNETSEVR